MKPVRHHWIPRDIIGGNHALDLVNTVSGWGGNAEDWIPDTLSFLEWATISGLLSKREKGAAASRAQASPVAAERVLASLKELRFALWQLIGSLERGKTAKSESLSVLNSWARHLALSQHVVLQHGKVSFALAPDVAAIDLPGLRVIAAAIPLLMDPPAGRIRTCPGTDCGWKFIDNSKNGSRRWCDMAVCGNLAKAKHFREKSSQR